MLFKIHPFAMSFPKMGDEEYAALKADILQNGQQVPIVKKDDEILDGRHRYEICQELGIEPWIVEWEGTGSKVAFIASMNLHRRHMTESQRGLIGALMRKSGNVSQHQDTDELGEKSEMSFAAAGAVMQVSDRTVKDAHLVLEKGTEREVEAIRQGKATVSRLAKDIRAGKTPKERVAERKKKPSPNPAPETPDPAAEPPAPRKKQTKEEEILARLREGLAALAFMPEDTSIVALMAFDAADREEIQKRMYKSAGWLRSFVDEWEKPRQMELLAQVHGRA